MFSYLYEIARSGDEYAKNMFTLLRGMVDSHDVVWEGKSYVGYDVGGASSLFGFAGCNGYLENLSQYFGQLSDP